jgi:hypothetical protein
VTRRLPHITGTRCPLAAFLAVLLVSLIGALSFLNPTSAFASDVSSYVTDISTNAEVYESTIIPVMGDAAPSAAALALTAGALVASSLYLRRRAR